MKNKINAVLKEMASQLDLKREHLLSANAIDVKNCDSTDKSLFDRLFIDSAKIDGMISSLNQVMNKESPLDKTIYSFQHDNGFN